MDSSSAEVAKRFSRRWRYLAYSLALGLPLLAIATTLALVHFDSVSAPVRQAVLQHHRSSITDLLLFVVYLNWPFLGLDFIVASKLRKRPDDAEGTIRSAHGALVGLTIPYVIGYSFWPAEMASGAPDAGQGIGLMLPILGWIVGPVAATVGWKLSRQRGTGL